MIRLAKPLLRRWNRMATAWVIGWCILPVQSQELLPNIVLIFTDDQGYADVGAYGAKDFQTPHLDRLASEGLRFTDFYVAQPVCSASRAALLTGCYPNRIGIHGALGPNARHGIHDDEMTLGELTQQKGYATAIYGKWHLGHHPQFLPTRHGFDEYYGLPYSNDMWPNHPTAGNRYPPLPLIEGETILEHNPDQSQLTTECTRRAVDFIERNKDRPFFLYLPHPMPHVPLFVSDKHKGKSKQGLYGDVIMEIDWSVGQILEALERNNLDSNTWVIFISDNGPWLSYGNHAGSALPLREGKGTTFEGGVRVPCIMRWPGVIPANSECNEPAMTIDLLPTIGKLIGARMPRRIIDGKDIWHLIQGDLGARSTHRAYFFYYHQNEFQALRSGQWKLHFPHVYRSLDGKPGGNNGQPALYSEMSTEFELYDLASDIGETKNLAETHPDVVERLKVLADRCIRDLGDSKTGKDGMNVREPGRLPND